MTRTYLEIVTGQCKHTHNMTITYLKTITRHQTLSTSGKGWMCEPTHTGSYTYPMSLAWSGLTYYMSPNAIEKEIHVRINITERGSIPMHMTYIHA